MAGMRETFIRQQRGVITLQTSLLLFTGGLLGLILAAAPDWFIRTAALPLPMAEAEVVRGWSRLGKVQVVSHPGRAYDDLWRITVGLLVGVLVIGGAGLLSLYLLLRRLLRPLKDVEAQARALGQRDFRKRVQVRSTRELNQVTGAMNQMADDLCQLFLCQGKLIQHLRKVNNEDPVTGLVSRAAFGRFRRGVAGCATARSVRVLAGRERPDYSPQSGNLAGDHQSGHP